MCLVNNLTSVPCLNNAAGLTAKGYVAPTEEITADPDYLATTGEGDTVTSDGAFTMVATTGKGFFRTFPTIIEKGVYSIEPVGAKGSKQWKETYTFALQGCDAPQLEFANNLLNTPSVFIVPDANDVLHVVGRKDSPATVDSGSGGTGEGPEGERIMLLTVTAYTKKPMIYDAVVDITPNA
jgi:hypothetical protein